MNSEEKYTTDPVTNLLMDEIINLKAEIAFLKRYIDKIPSLIADIKAAQISADAALSLIESGATGKPVTGHVENGMFLTEDDIRRAEEIQNMTSSQNEDHKTNILSVTPRNKYYNDLAETILDKEKPVI